MISKTHRLPAAVLAASALALGVAMPAHAQYRNKIANDMSLCRGSGPAVLVTVDGIKASTGKMRAQVYHATSADWLKKGRWLNRVEANAKAGSMSFCLPVPASGRYAVAVRHDLDGDRETDIFGDGGAMSNNPSVNVFNLGKPSHTKVAFTVGNAVKPIKVSMKYR